MLDLQDKNLVDFGCHKSHADFVILLYVVCMLFMWGEGEIYLEVDKSVELLLTTSAVYV